jgi:hypothetical protein
MELGQDGKPRMLGVANRQDADDLKSPTIIPSNTVGRQPHPQSKTVSATGDEYDDILIR